MIHVYVSENKQAYVFVLLGNPVYGRWFLDGSDPDVRLVAVIHIQFVQLMLGAGVRGRGSGVGFLHFTPYLLFSNS